MDKTDPCITLGRSISDGLVTNERLEQITVDLAIRACSTLTNERGR